MSFIECKLQSNIEIEDNNNITFDKSKYWVNYFILLFYFYTNIFNT